MEETPVSFITAKLAKEKGCDLYSDKYYDLGNNDKLTHGFHTGYANQQKSKGLVISTYNQSLLQKWLREIHFINISIDQTHKCYNLYKITKYDLNEDFENEIECNFSDFKTYEESLEIGLQEALKLIK